MCDTLAQIHTLHWHFKYFAVVFKLNDYSLYLKKILIKNVECSLLTKKLTEAKKKMNFSSGIFSLASRKLI